jgi:hypothetical protein
MEIGILSKIIVIFSKMIGRKLKIKYIRKAMSLIMEFLIPYFITCYQIDLLLLYDFFKNSKCKIFSLGKDWSELN